MKVWRISAEWIFHSHKHNEWMNEKNYEVDENGKKIVHHPDFFCIDTETSTSTSTGTSTSKGTSTRTNTLTTAKKRSSSSTSRSTEADNKRKCDKKQVAKKAPKNVLPKTQCSVCNKTMTNNALIRHMIEIHESNADKFSCNLCDKSYKRETILLDHKRRVHLEPRKMGRPNRNEKKHRSRSPFRKSVFEGRHGQSLQMNTQMMNVLNELEGKLEKTQNKQKKN